MCAESLSVHRGDPGRCVGAPVPSVGSSAIPTRPYHRGHRPAEGAGSEGSPNAVAEAAESDSIATPVPRAGLRDRLLAIVLDPANVLGLVLLLAFVVRAVWLDQPPGGLIWDEAYYVNAARVIDGLPVPPQEHYADAPPGIDPNAEHPPLGKVLIALSISVLGDGPLGWRLPSLVAGMVALFAFYGIVRGAGAGPWLADPGARAPRVRQPDPRPRPDRDARHPGPRAHARRGMARARGRWALAGVADRHRPAGEADRGLRGASPSCSC